MFSSKILTQECIDEAVKQGFCENKTLLDWFDEAVAQCPDQTAIVGINHETGSTDRKTYQELSDAADQIALGLVNLGIEKGDVVSFQLPGWWQFTATHIAVLRIGAVSNPLMPIFRERELSFMLEFVESKLIIIPNTFRGFDYVEMLNKLKAKLPALKNIISLGGTGDNSFESTLLNHTLADSMDKKAIFAQRRPEPNQVIQIMYTSGTTGVPKGVMHTSNTILCGAKGLRDCIELTSDDCILMGSPLAHQTGFLFGIYLPIMLKTKAVLLDVWSGGQAWKMIKDEGCSATMASTPFLYDLVSSPDAASCNSDRFQSFVCGGAPVPRALVEKALNTLDIRLQTVWGMTEVGAATGTCVGDPDEKIINTDGKAMAGMEVRVVDNDNKPVAHGEEGRLKTRGAFGFVGYLKRPEAYEVDDNDWFETGDLARMDAEGYIRISGRSKDILIRGGENIPIVEVENILFQHDAIQDVAVVAMPDERLGELGCCFITLEEDATLDFPTMKAYLQERKVSKSYWPERLEILPEMPRTASGKIQKFELREIAKGFVKDA